MSSIAPVSKTPIVNLLSIIVLVTDEPPMLPPEILLPEPHLLYLTRTPGFYSFLVISNYQFSFKKLLTIW
jgi:hypothetical protein